ncbi:hypothetical protein [Azospirillum sp. INR13]|uniref:hypothetical protein n=1 Tax=Azospirillum sp. INR13 TaxID=2596919 RepID=UPI0021033727|nr:hypothetical protein [Azospirillum sp. INR13]
MRKPSRLVSVVAIMSMCLMSLVWEAPPASAQRRSDMQILGDAETDHIIRKMARPIFQAAGIDPDSVQILLVNDPRSTPSSPGDRTSSCTPGCC